MKRRRKNDCGSERYNTHAANTDDLSRTPPCLNFSGEIAVPANDGVALSCVVESPCGRLYLGYSNPPYIMVLDWQKTPVGSWHVLEDENDCIYKLSIAPVGRGSRRTWLECLEKVYPLEIWPPGLSIIVAEYATEDTLMVLCYTDYYLYNMNGERLSARINEWTPDIDSNYISYDICHTGVLYVANGETRRVQALDIAGKCVKQWEISLPADESENAVSDIKFDSVRKRVFLTHFENPRVQCFDLEGNLLCTWTTIGENTTISCDSKGRVYLLCEGELQSFTWDGTEMAIGYADDLQTQLAEHVVSFSLGINDALYLVLSHGRVICCTITN